MNLRHQIISKIGRNNKIAGLEIILIDESTHKFNLCLLQKKGNVIEKISELSSNNDYSIISNAINTTTPVNIVVTGHGIINKKIKIEGVKENELINKVLPNANEKDLYFQKVDIDTEYAFVSLVRKDLLDKLLQELNDQKFEIIGCTFGPFCLNSVLPIIYPNSNEDKSINTGVYSLTIKEGKINSLQIQSNPMEKETYKMGEEDIQGTYLIAYSSALTYFAENNAMQHIIPYVGNSFINHSEKRIFSFFSKGVLALFLAALFVNYFLFNQFFQKQNTLESLLHAQKSSLIKYDTLKSVFAEKEDFLKRIGFIGKPKTSFYADELAKDIPTEVTLTEMNINPLKKNNNSNEEGLSFSLGIIDIAGVCRSIIEFNDWMKLIKNLVWVKELKVLNYIHDKEGGLGNFSIELYIK